MIPCNGCTQCCKGPLRSLPLVMDPNPGRFETYKVGEMIYLANKPNGDCLYLGDEGCTIYEDRPVECRVYDCRRYSHDITLLPNLSLAAHLLQKRVDRLA